MNDHQFDVTAQLVDGFALIEGDIIIATEAEVMNADGSTKGNFVTIDVAKRWPDGIVSYMLEPGLPEDIIDDIAGAIEHWEENTLIKFQEITDETRNHVYFQESQNGCSSWVGMRGGRQPLNLAISCGLGSTIHEIGHAVGLWHEHSRADRDNHIEINFDNIIRGKEGNFIKRTADGILRGEYDFRSIMHYSRTAFGATVNDERLETITVLDPNSPTIGQRRGLSPGDIQSVNFTYFPNFEHPCAPQQCARGDRYVIDDILDDAMKTQYQPDIYIGNQLVTSNRIIKVKNLTVTTPSKILFTFAEERDINDPFKAIIVDTLTFDAPSINEIDLYFGWDFSNFQDVMNGLVGEAQTEQPGKPIGYGANGLHGYQGGKGRTKHSPTVFLFFKQLNINNGSLNDITLEFDLPGLPGGNGGQGGRGGNGNPGKRGRSARNGELGTCRRGAGNGGNGGAPGMGGRGGDAGCGGHGSDVYFYFGDQVFWTLIDNAQFALNGGGSDPERRWGVGGLPGPAGAGGKGGKAGENKGNCHRPGYRGGDGEPRDTDARYRDWNLGAGSMSVPGEAGRDYHEALDTLSELVFIDPLSA